MKEEQAVAPDPCNQDVFKDGRSVCTLDACMHQAEAFAQAVARESGQRVDWHYSGGIANVLVLGDHARALKAARKIAQRAAEMTPRKPGECGSCSDPNVHRPVHLLRYVSADERGPYRAGDPLPEGPIGVVSR